MRGFLIAAVLVLTGLTFYSAFAYKSEVIEQDITSRVTTDLQTTGATDVEIEVDGRHVTLSGIVYDEAVETAYLDTADKTYGALGPIDGLTYLADGGYISALKTNDGIALRGSVPNETVRQSLLESASQATGGTVDDQLTISGADTEWQQETLFGMQQLAALSTGSLNASAAGFSLSGITQGNAAAVTSEVVARDGWNAFISSPVVETSMGAQIADLNGVIADKDAEIGDLSKVVSVRDAKIAALTSMQSDLTAERDAIGSELATLKSDMTAGQTNTADLRAELNSTKLGLESANSTIVDLQGTATALESDLSGSKLKLTGMTATVAALKAAVVGKEADAQTLNGRITDLEAELANRQQTLGTTDERVAALQAQVGEQATGLEQADVKISGLMTDLEGRDANIAKLDGDVTKLDAEVFTLNATVAARDSTIANLNGRLVDGSTALAADNDQIAQLRTTLGERDEKLVDLSAEIENRDGMIASLKGDVSDRDTTVAALNTTVAALNGDVTTGKGTIADLTAKISQTESQLGDVSGQLSDRDTLLAQTATKVAERDVIIASLQSQSGSFNVAEQCAAQASNVMEGTRINFGSGTARIDRGSNALLERLTGIALACVGDDLTVEVGGHTDSQGSDQSNQSLSEARAQAIVAFMAERGVPAEGVKAVGFGESQPIADNATSAGRAQNRRISFDWQAR